jgi:hypothetical protein
MPLLYPLVMWGTPVTSFTTQNCTVTTGQADPFGGTNAVLLTDTSAAAESYAYKSFIQIGPTLHGVFILKAGSAAATTIRLYDSTGAANRFSADITWAGPTVNATVGTVYGPVALGGGWYAFLAIATGVVNGNTLYHLVNPSGFSPFTPTTTVYWYENNIALFDFPDAAVSWPEPRDGSAQAQGASGTEDAWTIGTDEHWRGTIRWVPDTPRGTPAVVSGWYGQNEIPSVNCGVKAMLTAGRDKGLLRFVPDRSVCTTYMDSYLVEPMRGSPDLEPNWDRKFTLELRGTTVYTGY